MEDSWEYKAIEITKYDPIYRNELGHYMKDDWVGFFCIGKEYDGKVLTMEEYLKVEQSYIDAAQLFCQYLGISTLKVQSFQDHITIQIAQSEGDKIDVEYGDLEQTYHYLASNETMPITLLSDAIKLILRDYIWVEMIDPNEPDNAIRFGDDFYMLFNSVKSIEPIRNGIENLGLFIGR